MNISLEELLKGRGTIIKDKEYFSTKDYVEPFLERMSKFTDNFDIRVKEAPQLAKEDEVEYKIYNRVWVQAILPEELNFGNHYEVIHLLYALDTRKPLFKIARSAINGACLNQCVFNPTFINIQSLEPNTAIDYNPLKNLMEQTSDIVSYLKKLENIEVPYDSNIINLNLGFWVRGCLNKFNEFGYGKVKIATSTAIDAYKLLYQKEDSPYYIKPGEVSTMFNIYNAFTEVISHDQKDITNPLEKTLLLKDILDIV